jgi:putative transposase
LAKVLGTLEISEATWNRWRTQHGGMKAAEAKRLKELEAENARRLVANQALDIYPAPPADAAARRRGAAASSAP